MSAGYLLKIPVLAACLAASSLLADPGPGRAAPLVVGQLKAGEVESGCGLFVSAKGQPAGSTAYLFATSQNSKGYVINLDGTTHLLQAKGHASRHSGRKGHGLRTTATYAGDGITVNLQIKWHDLPDPVPNELESGGGSGRMTVTWRGKTRVLQVTAIEGC